MKENLVINPEITDNNEETLETTLRPQLLEEYIGQTKVKETYNDSTLYNDFYMTCIPWLSIESMTHPLIDNDYASLSCPRVCWDKYREENGKIIMTLNITVSHCFVDFLLSVCKYSDFI